MNTAEPNPPRKEQEKQLRDSPTKAPATETAHLDSSEIEHATAKSRPQGSDLNVVDRARASPYGYETEHIQRKALLPEEARPRGVDSHNDDASDDTVDTDAKDRDAKEGGGPPAGTIVSNATLINASETPAEGLAGIDSRASGSRPAVEVSEGSEVIYKGLISGTYGTCGASNGANAAVKLSEHLPPNHVRTGHLLKIKPKDES